MVRTFLSTFIAAAILSACMQAQPAPRPTEPTGTLTAEPTETIFIAETTNSAIPVASITWLQPGPNSVLASPISVVAQIPSHAETLRIELRGSDGRLLARQVLVAKASQVETNIEFEIARDQEPGRLSIGIDDELGRTVELGSIEVTFINNGTSTLQPARLSPQLVITNPQAGTEISGGMVTILGLTALADAPVHLELVTRAGRVLAADDAYPLETAGQFNIQLQYRLDEAEWVLVVASQSQSGILWSLDSAEVLLAP